MSKQRIKPGTVLSRQLENCSWPVYAFDKQLQLFYLNGACEQLTGVVSEQLIGVTLKYHELGQLSELEQAAACLTPRPESTSFQLQCQPIDVPGSQANDSARWNAYFFPLHAQQQQGTVAILVPESADRTQVDGQTLRETDHLHNALRSWRNDLVSKYSTSRLVGNSEAMQRICKQVALASESIHPVVLYGPQGTGREHVARSICYASGALESGPVISIRCELMDGELMNSTVRAFLQRCKDAQDGNTASLLLLEAEQLAMDAQAELYHLLNQNNQELRIVTTAREPLLNLTTQGKFREDLAYRLSTIEIALPSLAERPEDIPILAQALLEESNLESEIQKQGFHADSIDLMLCHDWPGNIDELAGFVQDAIQASRSPVIQVDDLPQQLHHAIQSEHYAKKEAEPINLDEFLLEVEMELIQGALRESKGNKTQAAKLLGISRARLHRRLEKPENEEVPTEEEPMFRSLDDLL